MADQVTTTGGDGAWIEKARSLSFGLPHRGQPNPKADELGNVTTEHWDGSVDVTIKSPKVTVTSTQTEER